VCVCVCERERRIFSREAKGQFSSKQTQRVTKKKNLPGQKRSPPPLKEAKMVCRSRPLPQREVARIFPSFFRRSFSLFRSTGANGPVDRGARGEGVIGSLGSRTPPVVRRKGKEERPFFEMGGARSFKPNTPTGLQIESERLRRESERADDVNDDAPSSCTRSTDSPRFFCGLLDCSSRVRFAFAFVSSSRCAPRPPRRRRLRCERFEAALPFERSSWSSSRVLLHRLRIYSSVREGESRP